MQFPKDTAGWLKATPLIFVTLLIIYPFANDRAAIERQAQEFTDYPKIAYLRGATASTAERPPLL